VTPPDWIADIVGQLSPLVTAGEAAAVLRTSLRNLRRLIVAGQIHSVRPVERGSSRVLIPRASIERYLRALDGDVSPDDVTPPVRARRNGALRVVGDKR
jgi:excisionase family DNA binding protein